jgi:hypothetical protein
MAKNFAITGDRWVDKQLVKLETKVAKDIIKQSLMSGVRPWLPKARAAAPKKSGTMAKALRIGTPRKRRGENVDSRMVWFGVASMPGGAQAIKAAKAASKGRKRAKPGRIKGALKFYGGIVEEGGKRHKAEHFLRKTFKAEIPATLRRVRDTAFTLIQQELAGW